MNPEDYRRKINLRDTYWLKKKAIENFNSFIRKRDQDLPCISCGNFRELQAGHYYSAGLNQSLRFLEKNANGQCLQCNTWLRGNLIPYRKNLISKYGEDAVKKLDLLAGMGKQAGHYKLDRFSLIEIIMKYK